MKIKIILCLLALMINQLASASVWSCESINQNIEQINQLKKSGQYRFAKSTKNVPKFDYQAQRAFSDYLAFARAQIQALNPKADLLCPVTTKVTQQLEEQGYIKKTHTVTDLIAPFELKQPNNEKVVLLIHGLTDSPYLFHDLAAFYFNQGFSVRTIVLPGHATAADQLMTVSVEDWRQATKYAIKRSQQDYKQVYLGGFSTGGALILDYALNHQVHNITGIMLFSPATQAKSKQAWLAEYINYLPWFNWLDKDADIDFAKYESFPVNAAAQVQKLMSNLQSQLKTRPKLPNISLFIAVSEVDQTIEAKATLNLFASWLTKTTAETAKNSQLVYYGKRASLPKALQASEQVQLLSCAIQQNSYCQKNMQLAHTSITNTPTNPHYGVNAVYQNCGHYLGDDKNYAQCRSGQNVIHSEKTPQALTQGVVSRLMYNPFYDELTQQIKLYLEHMPK